VIPDLAGLLDTLAQIGDGHRLLVVSTDAVVCAKSHTVVSTFKFVLKRAAAEAVTLLDKTALSAWIQELVRDEAGYCLSILCFALEKAERAQKP